MNILKLELENCYGIQKMQQDIDFSRNNVAVIYAPNGTMKSSFAKTFEAIRDGKTVEEKVYGCKSKYTITDENVAEISPESIMVINPFDENAYENQGTLMANEILRRQYIQIYKNIDQSKEVLFGKMKILLKYSNRSSFDTESNMLHDWGYTKKDLFLCLKDIESKLNDSEFQCALREDELNYNTLFNAKVYSMVTSGKTSELIEEYEKKYSELLEKSLYMQKGIIDHNNYANISDSLSNNGFFGAKNEIRLVAKDGSTSVTLKTQEELNELIKKETEQVLNTKELKDLFEKINKVISKNKDTQAFNAYLQQHPDIVTEYRNIDKFKKKVWIKAFGVYQTELHDLLEYYDKAQNYLKQL